MSVEPAAVKQEDKDVARRGGEAGGGPPEGGTDRPIPILTEWRIRFVRGLLMLGLRTLGLSGLYTLGRFFGTLEYLVDYRRRGRVHRKLRSMFKEEQPPAWYRRMCRRYFMRIRCDKMFYTIMDRIPRGKLMNRIKLKGRKHIDAALAKNKGLYVALCHFGSFHVAGLLGALLGYEIIGVRDPKESHVRRFIQRKYRESFPEVSKIRLYYANSFPRELFRALQAGKIVASLLDVDRRRGETAKTHPVRFFGETREFLTGPIQMAVRCGSTTLQAFVVSRRDFYYQMFVTPPLIEPEKAGDEEAAVASVMQQYADGVEAFARAHPDHVMNI